MNFRSSFKATSSKIYKDWPKRPLNACVLTMHQITVFLVFTHITLPLTEQYTHVSNALTEALEGFSIFV